MRNTFMACWTVWLLCLGGLALAQAPEPPEVAARAYLLVDLTANQVLVAKGADQPLEPASLTKLMSAYLVFDALKSKKIDRNWNRNQAGRNFENRRQTCKGSR